MQENRNTQRDKIKHLYWRAGFGLSPAQWRERRDWSVEKAVAQLFADAENYEELEAQFNANRATTRMARSDRSEAIKMEKNLVSDITHDWIMRMAGENGASELQEKMTLFWHGHFACRTKSSFFAGLQQNTLRKYGLSHFKDLLMAMTKDAAMMRFLDNQYNRKASPNENFARELLELFTLGIGNYTENDVKEAARAFTGWTTNRYGEFVFAKKFHDFGQKTFLGLQGRLDGEDVIDQILSKRATAEFLCRKIYRYFVNDEINERRVKELTDSFYRSNYHIGQLMQQIFSSDWFYDSSNQANKIKSPIILLAGLTRQLGLRGILPANLTALQKALGQQLFAPPNVAGWKGGITWVDNSTLLLRLQLPSVIFQISSLQFSLKPELERSRPWQLKNLEVEVDFRALQSLVGRRATSGYHDELLDYFILPEPSVEESAIMEYADTSTNDNLLKSLCVNLMSLPEYQIH